MPIIRSAARFGILLACFSAGMAEEATNASKIDEYMQALVKLNRFSGSILVAKDGRVIWSHGYQLANAESAVPNQTDTKFRIGSVTKQFTAMAIMILQERGKLRVRDTICQYVHGCPTAWRPITIEELLTHTSGIPDYAEFPDFQKTQALPTTPQELLKRFLDAPLRFTPGDKFEYSNSGYVVLGLVIEQVSGKSYKDFLQQNIFDVLKMANTGYDSNTLILNHRASGYVKRADTLQNARYIDMSVPFAAGALYSTVNDLLTWDQALYTEKLISLKSLDAMFTPYKELVGYGWAIGTLFNRKMEHHNGGIDGFDSNVARFPDDKLLVVVLSNLEGAPVDNITKDLAAIVFGEKYELPKDRKIVKLNPSLYDVYAGKYQITADIALTITREGEHVWGELSGSSAGRFELFPQSETDFFSEEPPIEVVFTKEATGRVTGCVLNGEYNGKKMP